MLSQAWEPLVQTCLHRTSETGCEASDSSMGTQDQRQNKDPTAPLKLTPFSPQERASSELSVGISSSLSFLFNLTYFCQTLIASIPVYSKEIEFATPLSSCHSRDMNINIDKNFLNTFFLLEWGGGHSISAFLTNIPNLFNSIRLVTKYSLCDTFS